MMRFPASILGRRIPRPARPPCFNIAALPYTPRRALATAGIYPNLNKNPKRVAVLWDLDNQRPVLDQVARAIRLLRKVAERYGGTLHTFSAFGNFVTFIGRSIIYPKNRSPKALIKTKRKLSNRAERLARNKDAESMAQVEALKARVSKITTMVGNQEAPKPTTINCPYCNAKTANMQALEKHWKRHATEWDRKTKSFEKLKGKAKANYWKHDGRKLQKYWDAKAELANMRYLEAGGAGEGVEYWDKDETIVAKKGKKSRREEKAAKKGKIVKKAATKVRKAERMSLREQLQAEMLLEEEEAGGKMSWMLEADEVEEYKEEEEAEPEVLLGQEETAPLAEETAPPAQEETVPPAQQDTTPPLEEQARRSEFTKILEAAGIDMTTVAIDRQAADEALNARGKQILSDIDSLVVISDDSDFIKLIEKARKRGIKTAVVGNLRGRLADAAHEWLCWSHMQNGVFMPAQTVGFRGHKFMDGDYDEPYVFEDEIGVAIKGGDVVNASEQEKRSIDDGEEDDEEVDEEESDDDEESDDEESDTESDDEDESDEDESDEDESDEDESDEDESDEDDSDEDESDEDGSGDEDDDICFMKHKIRTMSDKKLAEEYVFKDGEYD